MKHTTSLLAVLLGLALASRASAGDGGDILINDFEGSGWGDWKTEGQAFGAGPWHGSGDNPRVAGFEGQGLAASRNAPTGTLTSPEFTIQRDYINLKVGGGWYPGRTCVNLLIDGKVVHSQHGLGTGFGGQHEDYVLQWFTWDVRPYRDQTALIKMVDNFDYNSGFILVDHIVQSDTRKAEVVDCTPMRETYRPQFHFTAEKGWLSDPCGLFYYKGIYHLIYQHAGRDELSVLFSPTAWGHAVSTDLLHWRQLPDAIRCEEDFDWSGYSCYGVASVEGKPSGFIMSGSSVIDVNNDSGLKQGEHPPILGFYTYPGDNVRGQCMAYSTDGGLTFTKYQDNPVLPGPGVADRDPKVFQHGGKWYMALSHAWGPGHSGNLSIHLYESANLTRWSHLGEIPSSVHFCECPDIFPILVDGNEKSVKWILIAGDGKYQIGRFEGGMFQREAGPFPGDCGRNHYATQTWFDGRRQIQIAWMAKGFALPDMPFNQQMTFPRLLELKSTPDGPRLFKNPVREIESLRDKSHTLRDLELTPGADNPLAGIPGDLFDIVLDFEPGDAQRIELSIRGTPVVYDVAEKQVHCLASTMPLAPDNGHIKLRILVDRISIEVFGNGGQATMSNYFMPPKDNTSLALAAIDGRCKLVFAEVHELRSASVKATERSQ